LTIYDRIRELRIENNMSQDDLARAMGYKDRSMITKIESGKVDISQRKIISFAQVLGTTPGYLMGWTAESESDIPTSDELKIISAYRALSPRGQQLLMDRAEELKLLYGKKSEGSSTLPLQKP